MIPILVPTSQVFFHLAFVGIFLGGFIVRGFYERRARKTRSPLEAPERPTDPA